MVIPAAEDCTNGVDDDLDGFIDCADPDCFADPNCIITDGDECFLALSVFEGANPIDTSTYTLGADPVDYGLAPVPSVATWIKMGGTAGSLPMMALTGFTPAIRLVSTAT